MVGTFYATPGPDKAAFVTVGAKVGPDTTVCLIEAMKIFNEIKAETSGTIEEVLVKSGQPVEFGQPLFRIRPS
jgi:acetyl-CoA carboxylase biotin carboxyl carrier protein